MNAEFKAQRIRAIADELITIMETQKVALQLMEVADNLDCKNVKPAIRDAVDAASAFGRVPSVFDDVLATTPKGQ